MITTIIFDLGGVIVNLDPAKTMKAFKELGLPDSVSDGGYDYQYPFFYDIERGKISSDEFRAYVRDLLPNDISDETIDEAWCAMLLEATEERVQLIKSLSEKYTLHLLSNTNEIHINHFYRCFEAQHGFPFQSMFDQIFLSHELKERKPDKAIYEKVNQQLSGITQSDILFLDDSKENIEAAQSLGWNTCFVPRHQLMETFEKEINSMLEENC